MLSKERQAIILDELSKYKSITIQQISERLDVSESTVRRDLAELDAEGQLTKVHGGAVLRSMSQISTKDSTVFARKAFNIDEKEQIAKYAASLILDDDFVYLDAGTTTDSMIKYINAKNAVFVTNGFFHAQKLSEAGLRSYILGGEIKLSTESIVGEEALESLSKYHFTKGFFGTNGISATLGFSTPEVKEALIKKVAMQRTREKFILADPTKFSKLSSVTFADFTDAIVITTVLEDEGYKQFKNIIETSLIKEVTEGKE